MLQPGEFETLHSAVCERFPGETVGRPSGEAPAIHLYHAANSICSQKVRTVLAFLGVDYLSHQLDIFAGDTYEPAYVRLRARACQCHGYRFASVHKGSTAIASAGCDACVVPTLVDAAAGQVLVDSWRICIALDRRSERVKLVPEAAREAIEAELAIVDELPNYPLLAAAVARRVSGEVNNGFSLGKVARCERLIQQHANDDLLREAYQAKRAKEQSAADGLFAPDAQLEAETCMAEAFAALERRLPAADTFLFGAQVSMADLFWALELVRAEDLGLARLWQEKPLPKLTRYYKALCALPALQQAVLDWPGARLGKG